MMINRMLNDELERIKSIMASSGLRKMLQGSWWLTVTQFCLEGLAGEGASASLSPSASRMRCSKTCLIRRVL